MELEQLEEEEGEVEGEGEREEEMEGSGGEMSGKKQSRDWGCFVFQLQQRDAPSSFWSRFSLF
jgi:hypothetical protein